MNKLSPYYKAIAGFVAGALVAFLGATDGGVTATEWLQILLAGLGSTGLVYLAPKNAPKRAHNQGGAVDLTLVIVLIILVVLILLLAGVIHR